MIVRSLDDVEGDPKRDISSGAGWNSKRLLLKEDGMGFSLHETVCRAGAVLPMHYKNHLEAVYCIEGTGEIETVDDGTVYQLQPGTVYALDKHDRHILRPKTDLRFVCVFNPPVLGGETHDETGAYPVG